MAGRVSATGAVTPAAASTVAGSLTQRRPAANAARLRSTATPFSVTARSIASAPIGNRPDCRATPTTNTLAVVSSPKSPTTIRDASTNTCWWVLVASRSEMASDGKGRSGCTTIEPVGVTDELTTTAVRPADEAVIWRSLIATSWSNASSTSTEPEVALLEATGCDRDRRRSLTTGPAFCESPVWSRPRTWKSASIAAVPRIWLIVTTPVPPMPLSRMVHSSTSVSVGAGSSPERPASRAALLARA